MLRLISSAALIVVAVAVQICAVWLAVRTPDLKLQRESQSEKITKSSGRIILLILGVIGGVTVALLLMWLVSRMHMGEILWMILAAIGTITFIALQSQVRSAIIASAVSIPVYMSWIIWPNWFTSDLILVIMAVALLVGFTQRSLNFKLFTVINIALFLYDIVHVFFTGIMEVAITEGFSASRMLPMALYMPVRFGGDGVAIGFQGLGMGDIVVPGLLIVVAGIVAYKHRCKKLLWFALGGYAAGLILTWVVIGVSHSAQPALLYILPCVLMAILWGAHRTGKTGELMNIRREA